MRLALLAFLALCAPAWAQQPGQVQTFQGPSAGAQWSWPATSAGRTQAAPAAKTVSATLTTAELLSGIITVNEGAGGASALTLPLAADLDAALPWAGVNYAFEISLINISTVAAEDATMTTNTGWTLVGEMTVESNDADRARSAGLFLARKTATGAWTLYRIS